MQYLVERNGLASFKQFLRAVARQRSDDASALDQALRQTYSLGLDTIESQWLDSLRLHSSEVSPSIREDLDTTIAYYDTVRRYQQFFDSSADYRQLWVPDLHHAESMDVVADVTRHPAADENVALETLLIAAHDAQQSQDWASTRRMLASVNTVLDAGGAFQDPTAAQYLAVVRAAQAAGWEPQRISLSGDTATVIALGTGSRLTLHTFTYTLDGWHSQ
jgi:hypothetical protein